MKRNRYISAAGLGLLLLTGCTTMLDNVSSKSPLAAQFLEGTGIWSRRPQPTDLEPGMAIPRGTPEHVPDPPESASANIRSAATSNPASDSSESSGEQSGARPPNLRQEDAFSSPRDTASESRKGSGSTERPNQESLAGDHDTLTEVADLYGHFHYEEVMAQTLRLMDDVHVFDHDKASALLFAASAAYLVSRPRECVSFLTLAIQTDPQVSPRIDVFPTEVCRAYRVLRTRTK